MDTEAEVENEVTEESEDNSLMAQLAAAWDAAESEETDDASGETEPAEMAEGSVEVGEGNQPAEPDVVQAEPQADGQEDSQDAPVAEDAPPVGAPADVREVWSKAPKEVRDWAAQREKEFAAGIQKHAENAKRAEQMDQTLAPYQQLFAMNGGVPNFLPGLLQTASMLQMGNPLQQAQAAAQIIKQFGVDIGTLDNLLVGDQPSAEVAQSNQFQQMLQQHLQPIQQQLQTYQQREAVMAQQAEQQRNQEIDAFFNDPKNEFAGDVRGDIADLMEMAANRGQALSIKEAYEKACQLNPTISNIIRGREQQQKVAQKAQAAASIRGTRSGEGAGAAHQSMRAAIEAAWDSAGQI